MSNKGYFSENILVIDIRLKDENILKEVNLTKYLLDPRNKHLFYFK